MYNTPCPGITYFFRPTCITPCPILLTRLFKTFTAQDHRRTIQATSPQQNEQTYRLCYSQAHIYHLIPQQKTERAPEHDYVVFPSCQGRT
uniref:Uncharacterized protein n=1 Tax=Arundo donax TaxID=35708 RepID=A0A0A9C2R2_ARUDO